MTNLLLVLPDFDVKPYAHILPSLEKALVSCTDLLTLDAFDVAKRSQVPPAEVRKLAEAVLESLHAGIIDSDQRESEDVEGPTKRRTLQSVVISTLDDQLDSALDGGIYSGYLTEIVGER